MPRAIDNQEMNFDTLGCEETLDCKLDVIANRLRSIRNPWTGNKRKLVTDIFKTIDKHNIQYDTLLDLFCGSCSVGLTAKYLGKTVYANDILRFPYFSAKVYITNNESYLTEKEKSYLVNNKNSNAKTFVRDNYAERFTPDEAEFLDNYRENAQEFQGMSSHWKLATAYVAVLQHVMDACFVGGRLNKGQVLADLSHRLKHPRNNGRHIDWKAIRWPKLRHVNESGKHKVLRGDALSALDAWEDENIDLCYIDPPYGGQQSDYAYMYSFFEDYISGTTHRCSNKRCDEQINRFVKSKDYYLNFEKVLEASSHISCLVISYNDSSWASIDKISDCIRKYRKNVLVEEVDYNYNYRDASKGKSKEYIVIARDK